MVCTSFIIGTSSPKTASLPSSKGSEKNRKWVIFFLYSVYSSVP